MKNNKGEMKGGWVIVLVIVAVILVASPGLLTNLFSSGTTTTTTTTTTEETAVCPYQPTATYTQKDKFSSNIITGGTAYYKVNALPSTTSAPTNVNKGTSYQYWYSNTTVYVAPMTKTAGCGANDFIADSWQNGSVTLSGYDTVGNVVICQTAGTNNITLGANAQANQKITYQGTAKKSAMPFGGLMVVEYNSTISDVVCTGANIKSGNPSGFHITYGVSATTRTSKVFEVDSALDDGSGTSRTIDCQFTNGASAVGASSPYYVKFFPANYYLTNDGNFALDVEKTLNSDNTRTGYSSNTLTCSFN